MRRKVLSVVLCVCMMMTMAPFAFAEEDSAFDLADKITKATSGATITLPAGEYTIPTNVTYTDKALTIKAAKGANVSFDMSSAKAIHSANITFEDVTFDYKTNNDYIGLQHATKLTYNNCKINGKVFLYAQQESFTGCTFTQTAEDYNIWCYGSGNGFTETFENCTFIGKGKFVHVYRENSNPIRVNLTDCKFINSADTAVKSAVNVKETCGATVLNNTVYINNCTVDGQFPTNKNGGSTLYMVDDLATSNPNTTVYVNNEKVWENGATVEKLDETNSAAKITTSDGTTYYKTLAAAVEAVPATNTATTIDLLKDVNDGHAIDFQNGQNVTINFNHHVYSLKQQPVGSSGTVNQGFRMLRGSTVVLNDGTLNLAPMEAGASKPFLMLIHSYGTVTLNNFHVDATTANSYTYTYEGQTYQAPCGQYAVDTDAGTFTLKGNSSITARDGWVAFVEDYWSGSYPEGVQVIFDDDFSGSVTGEFSYGSEDTAITSENKNKCILQIGGNGKFAIGEFKINAVKDFWTNTQVNTVNNIVISGGYFTTDPSAYLADGKGLIETDIPAYAYKVGDKAETIDVDTAVKAGEPAVTIPDAVKNQGLTEEAVKNAASAPDTKASLAAAAAAAGMVNDSKIIGKQEDATNALKNAEISVPEDTTITVVVQPYLDVQVTSVDTSTNTLKLEITAKYNVVATTDPENIITTPTEGQTKNATIINSGDMHVTQPIQISIALPTNFADNVGTVYVQHKGHEYTATVSQDASSNLIATFTNPDGFSPFTISTESTAVAKIGENRYTSFQAAVDAANDGETITLLNNDAVSATMSGASRTIKVKADTGVTTPIKVSVNGESKTIDSTTPQVEFTYTRPSHSSSGSTTTSYNVNVTAATNGTVAADKKTAAKGAMVTVTATPSAGYVVEAVKVTDKDGKDVAVTEKDGKYVFTMPGSAVTVTGSFKAETPAESGLPFVDVKNGDWFYDAVKYAYENGLMTGTSATTFAPNGTMNRAMIVTVLYRLEKSPAVTAAAKFTDVPAGQWYSDAVAWAAANGIVTGYDETTFGPMNAVTREQLAAILFRYEQSKGLENVTLEENLNRFPDKDKISAYAVPALQWAVGQKVINGNADGTLDPTGTATRAQVAQILMNLLQ